MKRSEKGFTLIELMIVVAIIAIIAAIAIPNLLKSRMIANQNNAGAALKQLTSHEAVWKQGDYDRNGTLDYWTKDVAGFHAVYDASGKALAVIDKSMAMADKVPGIAYPEVVGGPTAKQGYFYQAMTTDESGAAYITATAAAPTAKNAPAGACTNTAVFGFNAFPSAYGSDGALSFLVNQDGVIWQQDLGASKATLDRKAAAPETAGSGWSQYGG